MNLARNKSKFMAAAAFAVCVLGASASGAQARTVEREADCRRDKTCIQEYSKHKTQWLTCLDQAGLSEKKRKKLEHKVEAVGIRNLKKQELLIFNSKRKECHKEFLNALSALPTKKDKDPRELPSPLDSLEKERKNEE